MNLYSVNHNLYSTCGVWIAELSDERAITEALERGDAVIVEVAAGSEAVTIHAVPVEDLATFKTLAEWTVFMCSGREAVFDSTFYRVDLEPMQLAREHRLGGGAMFIPHLSIGRNGPTSEDDDDDDGDEEGPAAAAVPVRPRPPRSR